MIAAKAGHVVVVRLLIEWLRNMNFNYCIDEDGVTGLGSLVFIHEISPQLCWPLIFIRVNHCLQPRFLCADVGSSP
jgi:hypothetical protein